MPDDPTLNEASELLATMEADEAPEAQAAAPLESGSAPEGERTAQPATEPSASPEPKPAGTPATEVKPPEQEPAPDNKAGTKFAKNQERLQGGWKQLNERKAELTKQEETYKQQLADFTRQQSEFKALQAKQNQPKHPPEKYEEHAALWQREAEQLEAQGDFQQADQKRLLASQAVQYAKDLRANPPAAPVTDAQAEAAFAAQQKEWWGKAGIDFPQVLKDGPEKTALSALIKGNPELFKRDPQAMYWASRMAVAETSAARVPAMDKELGELRAKVKELNEKLAIPGDGAATTLGGEKSFEQKTEAEQEAELRQEAAAMPRF